MIVRLLIFFALGVLLWFWWRWKHTEQPEQRRKMILNLVFWGLIIVIGGLAATGRIHWLGAAFAGVLVGIKQLSILALRFFPILAQIYGRNRGSQSSQPGGSTPSSNNMPESEARQILEVGPDADIDEIKRAHRKQMRSQHPDHGGNTYFAAKLNQAKDVLIAARKNRNA
jgi:DnaJ family protein C protein 19